MQCLVYVRFAFLRKILKLFYAKEALVLKLVQQLVEVDDGFIVVDVGEATSSLADSSQCWKSRCSVTSLELALAFYSSFEANAFNLE